MIILFYQIAVPFWHSFPERLRESGIRKRRKRAPRGGYPYRVPSMHVRRFCRAAPPIDRSRRLADGLPRRECPTGAPLPSTRRLQGHPNTRLTTACQPTCRHLRYRTEIMPGIKGKTSKLIGRPKAACRPYGTGNDGNEYKNLSDNGRMLIQSAIPPDVPALGPCPFDGQSLKPAGGKGDFGIIIDSAMTGIAEQNAGMFSTRENGKPRVASRLQRERRAGTA